MSKKRFFCLNHFKSVLFIFLLTLPYIFLDFRSYSNFFNKFSCSKFFFWVNVYLTLTFYLFATHPSACVSKISYLLILHWSTWIYVGRDKTHWKNKIVTGFPSKYNHLKIRRFIQDHAFFLPDTVFCLQKQAFKMKQRKTNTINVCILERL